MQSMATTCTEDRIQHALERCLHGLSVSRGTATWTAGLCLNCWSLQELVSRDPDNFLILLEQILQKTTEVQEKCSYDLLAPLALLFYSTVLCTPHFPPDSDLLLKAAKTYHRFLTWPIPYCSICQELLTFIDAELKVPGINYQRLVRAEQGLSIRSHRNSTVTVLLLNPLEVQSEFLSVANKMSFPEPSPHSAYVTLLQHAYQATFGVCCDLARLHHMLQSKTLTELEAIFEETTEAQELASAIRDPKEARQWLKAKLKAVGEKAGFPHISETAQPCKLYTIPIPVARCYTCSWNQDSFGLSDYMDSGYMEDSDESSPDRPRKAESQEEQEPQRPGRKLNRIYKLFKGKSHMVLRRDSQSPVKGTGSVTLPLRRTGSLCSPLNMPSPPASCSQRSHSLPHHMLESQLSNWLHPTATHHRHRRPFLSGDEDSKASTLRVVVFGSDRISGKVARAYSNLRKLESSCPLLTRYFKLQFFYIPVKRSYQSTSSTSPAHPNQSHLLSTDSLRHLTPGDIPLASWEDSTNDISHYLGMLDPWYERNVLGLMHLPTDVLCQQTLKTEAGPLESTQEQLPILADMLLYYCRFATRPVLLQVYQTELTFISGEKTTEILIHSLELGHSAAIRAIKASGPGSKRLGIDGDREAIPLTLQIIYSKGAISGRSRWNNMEKVCTSVNLNKACQKLEELDSNMESLTLTLTEVVKRQNSKSKKSYNQISTSQIKVDKVQIIGSNNCSFAVCLDQDERKILQNVVRCEVSPCYKSENSSHCPQSQRLSFLPPQNSPDLCSFLCLPIMTFSGALP
ncbi:phosphoinositide 3-kinase regulatory subunit 5 isoform X2 [Dromiciops gliroides]|uniref:phosphoinositide 3-kinase regulatory subunit 5 isoform X2 n=1 Tax=Dromiciops gliroides TaxID=33562 RepID=UPI001CC35AE8|nr:phosphoinositide 3-kinase regulatory subunit 5 isoform X2 [Dromiciops gliroides]